MSDHVRMPADVPQLMDLDDFESFADESPSSHQAAATVIAVIANVAIVIDPAEVFPAPSAGKGITCSPAVPSIAAHRPHITWTEIRNCLAGAGPGSGDQ